MPNLPFRPPPVVSNKPRVPTPPPARRRRGAADSLADELRRLPWFGISAAVHVSLLAILAAMVVRRPPPETFSGVFEVGLYAERPSPVAAPPTPPKEAPPKDEPPPEVKPEPLPKETAEPAVTPPVTPPAVAPEREAATLKAAPLLEVPAAESPARDIFAARKPVARQEALRQWGGSPASERAVDEGLGWLHRHQDPGSGKWDDGDAQYKLAPGLTGLAVLAFLGKGHVHTGTGPYRDTVGRGIGYLLSIQSSDGRFGEPYLVGGERNNRYLMYHQAIATMALAEAHALTHDARLEDPIRRAVAFIQRAQQDGGGWDYGDLRTNRNDTSVTGWQVMALKSAHAAGFEIDWQVLFGIMRHLDLYTNSAGEVAYANRDPGTWRRGPGMAAVGMFCYQTLGWPRDSGLLVDQADLLLRNLPDWAKMNLNDPQDVANCLHTMYYWLYGSLALFNMGGHWWREWNVRLRDLLIAQQHREGERRGSWEPPARGFDAAGGRVYTTAIGVLNLEIYYRYLPFYRGGAFDAVDILEKASKARGLVSLRRRALRLLTAFSGERARDLLAEALDDPDPGARSIAQQALVDQRSERVVPHLIALLDAPTAFARTQAIAKLEAFGDARFAPHFTKALGDPEKVVRDRAALALRRVTGEAPTPPPQQTASPGSQATAEHGTGGEKARTEVRGKVLVVDPATPDAVVLDVGGDHAVQRGMRFEASRDGKVVAVLEAEKVEATLTVARVVERRDDDIQEGDTVKSLPEPAVSRVDK